MRTCVPRIWSWPISPFFVCINFPSEYEGECEGHRSIVVHLACLTTCCVKQHYEGLFPSPCEKHMPEERPAPTGRATFSTRKDRSNKDKGNTERENHLERNAPCLSVPGTMQLPAKRRIHKGPPPSPLLNFAYVTHFCPFLAGRENHALWVFTNGFVKSSATRYNLL